MGVKQEGGPSHVEATFAEFVEIENVRGADRLLKLGKEVPGCRRASGHRPRNTESWTLRSDTIVMEDAEAMPEMLLAEFAPYHSRTILPFSPPAASLKASA